MREPVTDFAADADGGGLYLYGKTGRGKTRTAAWMLQEGMEQLGDIHAFGCWDTGELCSHLYGLRQSRDEFSREMARLAMWDDATERDEAIYVLFLGDFGHELSESFACQVRRILDCQLHSFSTTVITSQYTLEALEAKADRAGFPEVMTAITRRIRELMVPVNFDLEADNA